MECEAALRSRSGAATITSANARNASATARIPGASTPSSFVINTSGFFMWRSKIPGRTPRAQGVSRGRLRPDDLRAVGACFSLNGILTINNVNAVCDCIN